MSRACRAACAVAHAQDHHAVGIDPVTDDVWSGEGGLAQPRTGNLTPTMGKMVRPFPVSMIRSAMSRAAWGFKISNVAANTLYVGQRRESPNDLRYRGFGTGQDNSLGVPHERSHFTTSSWGTTRPASMSASDSAIARASASSSRSKMVLVVAMKIPRAHSVLSHIGLPES